MSGVRVQVFCIYSDEPVVEYMFPQDAIDAFGRRPVTDDDLRNSKDGERYFREISLLASAGIERARRNQKSPAAKDQA